MRQMRDPLRGEVDHVIGHRIFDGARVDAPRGEQFAAIGGDLEVGHASEFDTRAGQADGAP